MCVRGAARHGVPRELGGAQPRTSPHVQLVPGGSERLTDSARPPPGLPRRGLWASQAQSLQLRGAELDLLTPTRLGVRWGPGGASGKDVKGSVGERSLCPVRQASLVWKSQLARVTVGGTEMV